MLRVFKRIISLVRFQRALTKSGGDFPLFWREMVQFHGGEMAATNWLVSLLEANGDNYSEILICAFDWEKDAKYWKAVEKALKTEKREDEK